MRPRTNEREDKKMMSNDRMQEIKDAKEFIKYLMEKGYTLDEAKTILYESKCK